MRKSKRSTRQKPTQRRGPLFVVLGGVLLLLLAAFFVFRNNGGKSFSPPPSFTPEASGAGHLKVDRESVDLGNVPLGQTVQVAFTLTNTGDQPLRFTEDPYIEVKEGC